MQNSLSAYAYPPDIRSFARAEHRQNNEPNNIPTAAGRNTISFYGAGIPVLFKVFIIRLGFGNGFNRSSTAANTS